MDQKDYLECYADEINISEISKIRLEREFKKTEPNLQEYNDALKSLPTFKSKNINLASDQIKIGDESEFTSEQKAAFETAVKTFIPWKKGPFDFFGHKIDSEWRSDLKWNRIKENIGSLKGQKIADIGCNNGYFMFRMAAENPELVIGLEPYAKNYLNFKFIQNFEQIESLYFELLGTEHIHHYPKFFDKVFCLGILYHQTDPVQTLRKIFQSLKPSGELIIDCQGIAGEDPVALVPEGRYAQARGIWYMPTLSCLKNWMRRAQFRDIECFFDEKLSVDEQRTTKWAPIKSLKDFLDPNDPNKTIEGYPAPRRFYLKARR